MSRLGIIGEVLGLWPLVENAVAALQISVMLIGIKTERLVYHEFLRVLLAGEEKEDRLSQIIDKNEADDIEFWQKPTLHSRLEARIGIEVTELILKTLNEMSPILQRLVVELENINTRAKILKVPKFRTRLGSLRLKSYVGELASHNQRLCRLITNRKTYGPLEDSKQSMTPPGVSAQACDVYSIINNKHRCNCPFSHRLSLGIRRISSTAIDACEPFDLLLSVDNNNTEQISKLNQHYFSSLEKGKHRTISFGIVADGENHGKFDKDEIIDDLCTFIQNLSFHLPASASTSFELLGAKQEEFFIKTSSFLDYPPTFRGFVSLEDYLPPGKQWEINRRDRMTLALILTRAITVFYSTPWISEWWTWKDFLISEDDKFQIFIAGAFYGPNHVLTKPLLSDNIPAAPSIFWTCFGEPILTRLGFALIELALGKRLSEMRSTAHGELSGDQDMIDCFTAKSILADGLVCQEAGQLYHDAVSVCLSHQVMRPSGPRALDSRNPEFQRDLEKYVFEPIRDFCAATWGQSFGFDSTLEKVRASNFSSLDSASETAPDSNYPEYLSTLPTTPSSVDPEPNAELSLLSHNYTIEPEWITYEWEVPEVVRLRCRQDKQLASLAETIRTTIVIIGYDFHFEAAKCEEYLQREWGNIGIEILNLIISGMTNSQKTHSVSPYVLKYSVEPDKLSILIQPNLSSADRGSVLEALDWLCRAIRTPAPSGNLGISLSNQQLIRSSTGDSQIHRDLIPKSGEKSNSSHSDLQLSFHLQDLSPLPKSQELCWRALFKSGVIAMRPSMRNLEVINNTFARGLEVSFELMVQLSAVELPVVVDDGIVLVGYQTALIPISGSETSTQWHLETSERGQINPYELKSTKKEWLKKRDWKSFQTTRCYIGWCPFAQINLGTAVLENKVGWSDSKSQKETLHWSGISLGCQAATSNPIQVGLTFQANFSLVPNKVHFTPSNNFAKMLRDTSKEVAAVVDCLDNRSWIVPRLSLLLHMAHAWSIRNGIEPDPIPFADPSPHGSQAEAALRDSGDLILLGKGQDTFNLRQLLLGLNINLLQCRLKTEEATTGKIYGFEFMDVVCEPPMGGIMKRTNFKSLGKYWFSVVNRADAVVLCSNLGDAITPLDDKNQRNPICNILPSDCGYMAVPISCLNQLFIRQGRQDVDLDAQQDEVFKVSDEYCWRISGNPFADCTHSGQQQLTCWQKNDLLQKLTRQGRFSGILKDEKQIRDCVHIHSFGAVVFGDRLVRRNSYSVGRFLGGEKLLSATV